MLARHFFSGRKWPLSSHNLTKMNLSTASMQKEFISSDTEYADVEWDNLGFSCIPTDYTYKTIGDANGNFEAGAIQKYDALPLSPFAGVLNYGQAVFEGTKASRKDDNNVVLFRLDENWRRMRESAERMCLPCPSMDHFVEAVKQTVSANKRWVPPPGKGSLYIRPILMGSGPVLGVGPSPEVTFLVYSVPVGNYFKTGTAPLSLVVEEEYHRAFPGGPGGAKTITNYAPVFKSITRAKGKGFTDVLYLDCVHKKYIEELSSSNIFLVKGNEIHTPAANGRILGGITRKSVIQIAKEKGYKVEERDITVDELAEADEVFCTGTAVGVAAVGSVTYKGEKINFKTEGERVYEELRRVLVGIQRGITEDKKGWTVEI